MKSAQDYLPTKYWIMKSEPNVFSFADLEKKGAEFWDGVRNYQARNFMQNEMKLGHKVLFYHSNANPPGVAGVCEIVELAKPDLKALDKNSEYYDPKATEQNPRWFAVTVGKPVALPNFVTLAEMRTNTNLKDMLLLRKGQRLSVQPLAEEEFKCILEMGGLPFIRLPKKACALISNQVKNLDKNAEVYVIGSRADCLKRGGDIDILIISNVFSSDNKRDLRFSLEDMLGEQQIDIAVYKDKTPPFVQLTLNTAVKI